MKIFRLLIGLVESDYETYDEMCQNLLGGFTPQTPHTSKFISLDQNTSISNHFFYIFSSGIVQSTAQNVFFVV